MADCFGWCSCHQLLLVAVVYGALLVVVGVSPFGVVPAFDVLEDCQALLVAGLPFLAVQQFCLEGGEERFHDGVDAPIVKFWV